jgi:hypothetical protein
MLLLVTIMIILAMQPQYEKVAKLFNGPDAAHPGIILMTRVDCAMKVLLIFKWKFRVHFDFILSFWQEISFEMLMFLLG